jgi:hypothetical protein
VKIQRSGHAARVPRQWLNACLFLCSASSVLFPTRGARADVSSWAFVGGGAARLQQEGLSAAVKPTMRLQIGLGTPPSNPVVFGGLFSLEPNFGYGSDLALLFRSATRSYVNGNFGLALDLGPYERFWGEKSVGGAGTLWLGAPWGIALGVNGSFGSHDARGMSAILGLDFARLTVYRNSGTNWLPNPFPAYRPKD